MSLPKLFHSELKNVGTMRIANADNLSYDSHYNGLLRYFYMIGPPININTRKCMTYLT